MDRLSSDCGEGTKNYEVKKETLVHKFFTKKFSRFKVQEQK